MEKQFKEEILKELIAKVFEITPSDVSENSSPDTIEKWDSLHHMSLIVALEESFGIEISEDQTIEMLNYPLIKLVLQENGVQFN